MSAKRDLMSSVDIDDGYVYLASPLTQHVTGPESAFADACHAAGYLMDELGVPVFSPIAHSYSIHREYGDVKSDTHDFWLSMDDPILRKASAIAILAVGGWNVSYGISVELERFIACDTVLMMDPRYAAHADAPVTYGIHKENRIALVDYIRTKRTIHGVYN